MKSLPRDVLDKLPPGRGVNLSAFSPGAGEPHPVGAVEIPIPPSTNALWRAIRTAGKVRVVKSRGYARWLAAAVPLLAALPVAPPPVGVRVLIRDGAGWVKGRDLDNAVKAVLDALRHAGRIGDDDTAVVTAVLAVFVPAVGGRPAGCDVSFFSPERVQW